jgi:hypothetical protein
MIPQFYVGDNYFMVLFLFCYLRYSRRHLDEQSEAHVVDRLLLGGDTGKTTGTSRGSFRGGPSTGGSNTGSGVAEEALGEIGWIYVCTNILRCQINTACNIPKKQPILIKETFYNWTIPIYLILFLVPHPSDLYI